MLLNVDICIHDVVPIVLQRGAEARDHLLERLRVGPHLHHLLVRGVAQLAAHALLLLDHRLQSLHHRTQLRGDGGLLARGRVCLCVLRSWKCENMNVVNAPLL